MSKQRKFIDRVKIQVSAGNGGDGSASFRREKYVPRGGPDGGDGGNGGHVILKADDNVDSLVALYFQPVQRAEHGQPGRGRQQYGRGGESRIITVPCGTEVYDEETDRFIGEVINPGDEMIVARGGRGGIGNIHFKSSVNRAPRQFTPGEKGQTHELRLVLKLISDAGLVGYPNAGKSTLISKISHAHPKIAPYPFTTINPIIGTVITEDYRQLKVADIPGLIKGAHQGVGLGFEFLRHIERTRFLVYVIDMAGVDGRNPSDDYRDLRNELYNYRPDIIDRPHLIVANKMDISGAEANLLKFIEDWHEEPIAVSAIEGSGVEEMKKRLATHLLD